MQVCDLIACGGEANTFPKHFAYFLPEDEDVNDPDAEKKTILFRNAYALRHEKISRRLGEAMLVGPRPSEDVDPAEVLVMWLRGHDIAHAVTLPGDGRVGPEDLEGAGGLLRAGGGDRRHLRRADVDDAGVA